MAGGGSFLYCHLCQKDGNRYFLFMSYYFFFVIPEDAFLFFYLSVRNLINPPILIFVKKPGLCGSNQGGLSFPLESVL